VADACRFQGSQQPKLMYENWLEAVLCIRITICILISPVFLPWLNKQNEQWNHKAIRRFRAARVQ